MREEILKITMTVDNEKIMGTAVDQVRGPRGYSAYEIAVLLGYVGNEESWLESLGGDQGRSAYRVAVDEGFVGTVNEWRDSLIGPRGPVYDDSDLREQIDLELASLTRIASEAADVATTKAGEAVDAKNIVVLRADEVDGHAVILYGLFDEIEDYRQEVYSRALESVEQAGIAITKAGEAAQSASEAKQSLIDRVQTTGQSTEKIMSQKAVTDELEYLQRVAAGYVPFIGSYGLSHDGVADTYERVGSENFTAIQSMFRRCLLLPDGTVDYFLSPENSNYKADGTPANITGANGYLGNVMVQIPKYYRKITVDGDVSTREVSLLPEEGFTLHPAFIKAGEEVDFRYYRAYQGVEVNGKLRSVSGAVPTRLKNISQFRNLAKANGTDWHQIDWYILDAVRELSSIEIGTYRSQSVLGQGNSTGSNFDLASGTSNEIGNGSSTSATSGWMSYRGIENFYASLFEIIDGINVRDYEPFVNGDHRTFASNVFTGDYVTAGVTLANETGFISAVAHTEKGFFISTARGSSTTFFTDYYTRAVGNRIWRHGGAAVSDAGAGSFCAFVEAPSSAAYNDLGAGLAF